MSVLFDYYRTGYAASVSRYSFFEKRAYGEDEHREIAQYALPAMAPGGAHPDIARRYLRGSTTIDTALRGTHPWLGGVSPSVAAQHSFRLAPGTAGRRVVGQNILQRHREGIDSLAKGMAASQPELIRQGLHTLGGANHTLADLSSHFERGLDTAPITQERSSPLGKAVNRVLPAQTAATLEQLIAHTTSSPDKITGDKLDRLAMRRAAGHGAAIRNQTIRRLVGTYGLSSVDAERLFDQHMSSGVPSAPTRGGFSRGLQALEGAIAPDAIIDAARTPSKLPARLRSSAKNVGNLAAQYAAHVGETSPIARGANNLLRRLFHGGRP